MLTNKFNFIGLGDLTILSILAILPFILPSIGMASDIVIFSLFGLAYNITFGYGGMISFGHAMFFGLSAYVAGMFLVHLNPPEWAYILSIFIGVGASTSLAACVGWMCIKIFKPEFNPAYFALTTLAISQFIYFLFLSPLAGYTGGSEGLYWGIPSLVIKIPTVLRVVLSDLSLYYFFLSVFLTCFLCIKRIVESPFGHVLQAIRENELRVIFSGYDTFKLKFYAFVFSGLFSGIAGALYLFRLRYVGLDSLHWLTSALVVLMCLLGGMRTFYGPILGATVIIILKEVVAAYMREWMLIVGVITVLLTLFFRQGIASLPEYIVYKVKLAVAKR